MTKSKRFLSFVVTLMMIISMGTMVFALSIDTEKAEDLKIIELKIDEKHTIQLYPESTLTKEVANKKFEEAIEYIRNDLKDFEIEIDIDNEEFQKTVKRYFLIDIEDREQQKKIIEFAKFMDYYENKNLNKRIIDSFESRNDEVELEYLLPVNTMSTLENVSSESKQKSLSKSSYSGSTAADYARNWWNKTNNATYPYYADYYEQDTTRNDYNDLREGESGQSDPRRAWNDCTNFVSQAIKEGGISTIKKGLINPHKKDTNWYYNDSKPSYTWGGAHNFYKHFSNRAGVASSSSDLQVGDAVSVDFTGDGNIDHTIIITKTTGIYSSNQYVTYHTYDTCETKTLSDFYNSDPNVKIYGYELDKL